MHVFIKGLEGETLTVTCDRYETVGALKNSVARHFGADASCFSLSTGVRFLDSQVSLADSGIAEESTLYVNCELLGAGKKRKKKTHTTPKKIKHKKKKVKFAVLKFYKVDAQNQISRLRRECPSETCGAGVFMAKHHDRNYCGRCGTTYVIKKDSEQKLDGGV